MTEEVSTVIQERIARKRQKAANVAHAALSLPPKRWSGATVLVLTFVAFLIASSRDTEPIELAIIVGVLLLHEGGHLLGMWAFGFSDLRMFFLPFLGAAVSGRKPGASAVQHAIVSLLGPVPGLLLALPLAFFADVGSFPDAPLPVLAHLVLMLVLLNGFNLIPILPLDGGRLFQKLLFARTPLLDVVFRVLAIGGIGWIAYNTEKVFGVIAFLMLAGLRHQAKLAFEGARLRRAHRYPADVAAIGDEELAALHAAAERATSQFAAAREETKKRILQQSIRDLFDRVSHESPKWWQTAMLLFAWALAIGIGLAALFVMFRWNAHR